MELALGGRHVVSVGMDGALVLITDRGDELRVESAFRIVAGDVAATIDPADAAGEDATLEPLRGEITAASAAADGTLELRVGTTALSVPPDPDFEAWGLVCRDGARVVCMPGGGLTTWPAEARP